MINKWKEYKEYKRIKKWMEEDEKRLSMLNDLAITKSGQVVSVSKNILRSLINEAIDDCYLPNRTETEIAYTKIYGPDYFEPKILINRTGSINTTDEIIKVNPIYVKQ